MLTTFFASSALFYNQACIFGLLVFYVVSLLGILSDFLITIIDYLFSLNIRRRLRGFNNYLLPLENFKAWVLILFSIFSFALTFSFAANGFYSLLWLMPFAAANTHIQQANEQFYTDGFTCVIINFHVFGLYSLIYQPNVLFTLVQSVSCISFTLLLLAIAVTYFVRANASHLNRCLEIIAFPLTSLIILNTGVILFIPVSIIKPIVYIYEFLNRKYSKFFHFLYAFFLQNVLNSLSAISVSAYGVFFVRTLPISWGAMLIGITVYIASMLIYLGIYKRQHLLSWQYTAQQRAQIAYYPIVLRVVLYLFEPVKLIMKLMSLPFVSPARLNDNLAKTLANQDFNKFLIISNLMCWLLIGLAWPLLHTMLGASAVLDLKLVITMMASTLTFICMACAFAGNSMLSDTGVAQGLNVGSFGASLTTLLCMECMSLIVLNESPYFIMGFTMFLGIWLARRELGRHDTQIDFESLLLKVIICFAVASLVLNRVFGNLSLFSPPIWLQYFGFMCLVCASAVGLLALMKQIVDYYSKNVPEAEHPVYWRVFLSDLFFIDGPSNAQKHYQLGLDVPEQALPNAELVYSEPVQSLPTEALIAYLKKTPKDAYDINILKKCLLLDWLDLMHKNHCDFESLLCYFEKDPKQSAYFQFGLQVFGWHRKLEKDKAKQANLFEIYKAFGGISKQEQLRYPDASLIDNFLSESTTLSDQHIVQLMRVWIVMRALSTTTAKVAKVVDQLLADDSQVYSHNLSKLVESAEDNQQLVLKNKENLTDRGQILRILFSHIYVAINTAGVFTDATNALESAYDLLSIMVDTMVYDLNLEKGKGGLECDAGRLRRLTIGLKPFWDKYTVKTSHSEQNDFLIPVPARGLSRFVLLAASQPDASIKTVTAEQLHDWIQTVVAFLISNKEEYRRIFTLAPYKRFDLIEQNSAQVATADTFETLLAVAPYFDRDENYFREQLALLPPRDKERILKRQGITTQSTEFIAIRIYEKSKELANSDDLLLRELFGDVIGLFIYAVLQNVVDKLAPKKQTLVRQQLFEYLEADEETRVNLSDVDAVHHNQIKSILAHLKTFVDAVKKYGVFPNGLAYTSVISIMQLPNCPATLDLVLSALDQGLNQEKRGQWSFNRFWRVFFDADFADVLPCKALLPPFKRPTFQQMRIWMSDHLTVHDYTIVKNLPADPSLEDDWQLVQCKPEAFKRLMSLYVYQICLSMYQAWHEKKDKNQVDTLIKNDFIETVYEEIRLVKTSELSLVSEGFIVRIKQVLSSLICRVLWGKKPLLPFTSLPAKKDSQPLLFRDKPLPQLLHCVEYLDWHRFWQRQVKFMVIRSPNSAIESKSSHRPKQPSVSSDAKRPSLRL